MEALKIVFSSAERKPCVCAARGLTYEGARRRKVRLDLLSSGDLRRNAQTLIAAEDGPITASTVL